jgi:ribosomal protein S18 acetylase RimI-like enzyme
MKISKALPADIEPIMELIHDAVKDMHSSGLYQWNEEYPTADIITEDVSAGTLYKATEGDCITGVIVLNRQYFSGYETITWEDKGGNFLVVHRLCIHPSFQGKGLAKKLMSFAEEYAVKHKYSSIRLDTSALNKTALGLYDKLNYRRVGSFTFDDKKWQCFEKVFK